MSPETALEATVETVSPAYSAPDLTDSYRAATPRGSGSRRFVYSRSPSPRRECRAYLSLSRQRGSSPANSFFWFASEKRFTPEVPPSILAPIWETGTSDDSFADYSGDAQVRRSMCPTGAIRTGQQALIEDMRWRSPFDGG